MAERNDGGTADCATLRDYFAAAAMQGELARQTANYAEEMGPSSIEYLANISYAVADAMLKAREVSDG
ncbi:MAG: hypothetical protein IID44_10270 [Planctomycetes bacterium]|nr:hypothetical protein [Planctomycetota bacterium]